MNKGIKKIYKHLLSGKERISRIGFHYDLKGKDVFFIPSSGPLSWYIIINKKDN